MFYFFVSLIFANLFLYSKNYIYLLFVFVSLFLLGKKVNLKLYIVCCLSVILFYSFNIKYYDCSLKEGSFKNVVEITEQYENYSIVEQGGNKYLIYNKDNDFKEGNKIYFEGELVDIADTYNDF